MRICFIGKYPPIQGGVSTQCYWTARGLAQRGHEVFVVTNAEEVESTFRIELDENDRAEGGAFAPVFPESGGRVVVRSTAQPDKTQLYYVPMGNPTVSRLAGLATETIRAQSCDIIYSYYFEPYCVSAFLASRFTGVPFVVKHAGSDLNRLMKISELLPTYREVLLGANRVISRGMSRKTIIDHGVPEHRIDSDIGFSLPAEIFRPRNGLDSSYESKDRPVFQTVEKGESSPPVLGVYGKLGEWKGSFDLLHAFAKLIHSGFQARLVALTNGWQAARFAEMINDLRLAEYVEVRPFIPHWKIPEFIHGCTAVAFLERDFPIAAHTPTIPSEILACGTCLIVSAEVLQKQLFRSQARHQQNLVVVSDPKDHAELHDAIRFALEDPARAAKIGINGHQNLSSGGSFGEYIDSFERLFEKVRNEELVENRNPSLSVRARRKPTEVLTDLYPHTSELLDQQVVARFEETATGSQMGSDHADRRSFAMEIGSALLGVIAGVNPTDRIALAVCRYELKCHEWSGVRDKEEYPPTPRNLPRQRGQAAGYLVRLQGNAEVVAFDLDVESVVCALSDGGDPRRVDDAPTYVLFHKGSPPMRVNGATVELLDAIGAADGYIACGDLIDVVARRLICTPEELSGGLFDILEGLMWEGVVSVQQTVLPRLEIT